MPNWIYNKLVLQGSWNEIKQIIGSDRKNPIKYNQTKSKSYKKFKFDLIAPVDQIHKHESSNIKDFYDPHTPYIKAWGTKWQPGEVTILKQIDQVILEFQTAWDPPTNWINILAEKFPNVKFNLSWADEDFPRCGSIMSNPIEKNAPVYTNYKYNSDEAVEFVKNKFTWLYDMRISSYNECIIVNKINSLLDEKKELLENNLIRIECIGYDKNDFPIKYRFYKKNENTSNNFIVKAYEISKNIFVESNIKTNIDENFEIFVEK